RRRRRFLRLAPVGLADGFVDGPRCRARAPAEWSADRIRVARRRVFARRDRADDRNCSRYGTRTTLAGAPCAREGARSMNDHRHLTEDERQAYADDAVPTERRAELEAHLVACAECFQDVTRLRKVTMRFRGASKESGPVDELWPSIRTR